MTAILVSVLCPDRTGLVAAVAGRLFELGANLGDTSFAALSGTAEFTSVCDFPEGVSVAEIEAELKRMPELADAEVQVSTLQKRQGGPLDRITHYVVIGGGDRPGLIARLSEAFGEYDANILRLDAQRIPDAAGGRYMTRFAVAIPERSAAACLATVANTAGELGLSCHWQEL